MSEECVREMAAGAMERAGADVAIATSGVAGPGGGTAGTSGGHGLCSTGGEGVTASRRYQMRGTRDWIKMLTSQVALDWVRRYALGLPVGGEATIFRR